MADSPANNLIEGRTPLSVIEIKPALSQDELQRQICASLIQETDRLYKMFEEYNGETYAAQMRKYNSEHDVVTADKKLEPRSGFVRKWAMPQEMYHWLRGIRPDGVKNFAHNLDYMRFLRNRHDWMKPFELADKPWQDIAGGTSAAGGVLPKEERDRLTKENELAMDSDGKLHRANNQEQAKC